MPSSMFLRPESRKRPVVSASLLILVALLSLGMIAVSGWSAFADLPVEASVMTAVPPVESVAVATLRTAAAAVKFDFDGDGKADISRSRVLTSPSPAVHEVRFRDSGDGTFADYSVAVGSGKLAPGDFNGDVKTDAAIFNAGTWTYKTTTGGSAQTISLGTTGDIPVAADYDYDGITDAAVFRPSTGVWYIKQSSTSNTVNTTWGQSGDIPTPGDYDGDGRADFAVWRPSNNIWYLNRTTAGTYTTTWGVIGTDIAVPADYDGDDKTDIAVFRRTTGVWYVRTSTSGFANWITQSWGNYGDQPVPADYDGDGIDDYAIWRPKTGWWWIVYSSNSSIQTFELGVQGNTAVPSAYLQQVSGTVPIDELAAERLKPRNAMGGTDLYSQNFSWSRNLVLLPGRSALDLSLGISYNSLVWTKADSEIYFDLDMANVTPGFRLGFPTIEPIYFDEGKSKFAYMMVTNSGSRIQFRETTVSSVYETADSSYTVLETTGASNPNDPVENITITVKTTDGTQMKYEWRDGAFKCTQIKDRNGNYITVVYNTYGNLDSVTDTLGRTITVTYTTDRYPSTITQTWKDTNGSGSDVVKTWATFTYMNMDGASGRPSFDTSFNGLTPIGPPDGTQLKVLQKITYLDQSSTKFDYNSYGQVYKVSNIAADLSTHVLNSTEINIAPSDLTTRYPIGPADVPRFTSTSTIAENFNMSGSTPQAVVVTNSAPAAASSYALTSGISVTSSVVKVGVTGHPNQLYSRLHFGGSGWKEGLVLATEDCTDTGDTCTTRKRWTWTNFTQDNEVPSYILNPRPIESQVGDGSNTKKTTISYRYDAATSSYLYGLPETITVGDLSTVLKTQTTSYNLSSEYASRRIIGLPSETNLWEGTPTAGTLMSKVTFLYDENGYTGTGQSLTSATRHCTSTSTDCPTAYGTSFSYRGNQTSIRRWDSTAPTTESVVTTVRYNIAGSPISQTTPWYGTNTRTVSIGYTDVWNDSVSRTTYAYPTSITDPNNQSSTVKYRFDIGANVEGTSPAPTEQAYGKTTKRIFDAYGRVERDSVYVNTIEKSYTRYDYLNNNGIQLQTYSTVVDVDGDENIIEDEAMIETFFDGAGRPLRTRTPHPGSLNGWSATETAYDILGRVSGQTAPAEVSVSSSTWTPAGDDSAGYKWIYQKYDWMGRVVRKINTDGNPAASENHSDIFISYAGCGCAGGVEITISGELVPRTDTSGNARRKQKIYQDILGRTTKTETFEWDGTNVYSTVVNTFNSRDQIVQSRRYAGSTASGTYQDTTAAFDGHGRLASSHKPEQRDSSNNLKYTTYSYNPDDSILSVTDGRGVVNNYEYNSIGFVTALRWTVPSGSGITDPTDVLFTYDNLGNRTSMTDGLGEVDYEYNSLSQMTAEIRDFTDTLNDAPSGGVYRIDYTYGKTGQLASITEPFGETINYSYDQLGRSTGVDPTTAYGDLPQNQAVVSGMKYNAFGSLKQADYGNGTQATMSYNNRLQPSNFRITNTSNSQVLFGKDYYYTTGSDNGNDGRVKRSVHIDDTLTTETEEKQNRHYTYDSVGRVKTAAAGEYACYSFGCVDRNGPFKQTYHYNAFGDITQIDDWDFGFNTPGGGPGCYGCPRWFNYTEYITNNRTSASGLSTNDPAGGQSISVYEFDNDGRITKRGDELYSHNAAGLLEQVDPEGTIAPTLAYAHDGNGEMVKQWNGGTVTNYYIKSTLLGTTLVALSATGGQAESYVLSPSGANLASLQGGTVRFFHRDPAAENGYSIDMNKSATSSAYDPTGRIPSTSSPGGVCVPSSGCIGPAGIGGMYGGFDGMEMLARMRRHQQWRDTIFWNLSWYMNNGPPVGIEPPPGWNPYEDNLNRISDISGYGRLVWYDGKMKIWAASWAYDFGESWGVGADPGVSGRTEGVQLPKCLRDFLRPFFPSVQLGNWTTISPVDDARFISTPGLAKLGISAMTRGLYHINYDPKNLDLTGGANKSSIEGIAEEIAHAVQFIAFWEKQEMNSSPNGSYGRAQGDWAIAYMKESGRVVANNLAKSTDLWIRGVSERLEDLYWDNSYEKAAKEKAQSVYQAAKALATSPCYP